MVVSLKGPPVGIPLVFQNLKADEGNPPKHPLPQYEQHDNKYNGDILVWSSPFEKMQILSLIVSIAPKAQYDPQRD